MMRRIPAVTALALYILGGGGQVAAQVPQERALSLAAGGGVAVPMHADLNFTALAWQVGVRHDLPRRFSFEGTYAEWRYEEEQVHEDLAVRNMTGSVGRIGRLTQNTTHVARTLGANALFRGRVGHVVLWGGGGPAWMFIHRDYRQTQSGCAGAVSCDSYGNTHAANSFAAQAVFGADVAILRRVAVFGQYSVAVPIRDAGSGHVSLSAGARVRL